MMPSRPRVQREEQFACNSRDTTFSALCTPSSHPSRSPTAAWSGQGLTEFHLLGGPFKEVTLELPAVPVPPVPPVLQASMAVIGLVMSHPHPRRYVCRSHADHRSLPPMEHPVIQPPEPLLPMLSGLPPLQRLCFSVATEQAQSSSQNNAVDLGAPHSPQLVSFLLLLQTPLACTKIEVDGLLVLACEARR